MEIPHSASDLGEAEADAARRVCSANYVGYGPEGWLLEEALRQRTGRSTAFAVLSGSHALSLSVAALDLPPGSPIGLPVLTCASVLHAILEAGHRPCLVDVRLDDLTLDVGKLPSDVSAIIAPHAYGAPADVEKLAKLGVPWIEDCATSPATLAGGRAAGCHGVLSVFSFGATKYITGGTGGLVVTDDPCVAERVAAMVDENPERATWRHRPRFHQAGRMADLNAAVARVQVGRMEELRSRRQAIASRYLTALADFAPAPFHPDHSYYRAIVRVEGRAAEVAAELRRGGVDARASVNPWLDEHLGERRLDFEGAEHWRRSLLSLPIHPRLGEQEVERVVRAARVAIDLAMQTAPR